MNTASTGPLVLSLDPGFASFGYALLTPTGEVVTLGVLRTEKSNEKAKVMATEDNVRRARVIANGFTDLLEGRRPGVLRDYRHVPLGQAKPNLVRVRLVCAESMSFPRSSSAAAKMAMSWGVIVGGLVAHDLPLIQTSPQAVKKCATGNASASKKEVEAAMIKRFGRGLLRMLKGTPEGQFEHAFDALAVGAACLDSDDARMLRGWGT